VVSKRIPLNLVRDAKIMLKDVNPVKPFIALKERGSLRRTRSKHCRLLSHQLLQGKNLPKISCLPLQIREEQKYKTQES